MTDQHQGLAPPIPSDLPVADLPGFVLAANVDGKMDPLRHASLIQV